MITERFRLVHCLLFIRESGELKPMDAEQLRENAHKMVDFIADYYKSIENFPVLSQVQVPHSLTSFLFPRIFFKYAIIYLHSVAFACFVSMITLSDIITILFIGHISLCIFHMQPGYLHNLIPDSAPHHPESLQNVLDGEVIQSVSYNLKLLGKKEKKKSFF